MNNMMSRKSRLEATTIDIYAKHVGGIARVRDTDGKTT